MTTAQPTPAPTVGELFAGIGGMSLGLAWAGFNVRWQVEIDEWCRRILESHWPDAIRFDDIRTLDPDSLAPVDLICGGYPCQPFSNAGKRKGSRDDRHLWPEVVRILRHLRRMERHPAWCLFENVDGHVSMGLDSVLSDLEGIGYTCWPLIVPACAVGARHQRNRVWIVANAKRDLFQGRPALASKGCGQSTQEQLAGLLFPCPWPSLSVARAFRAGDGFSRQVDRNRAIGNAVVPQVAYMMGMAIRTAHEIHNLPYAGDPT
ncbi:DNA (cytosine-5)-methyltransferase 1 [Desulfobaculum xiamenense]|uniref:Cytosine-specific methyltransferase n=1 Tax=Desulfobaculum xiamenense TaxID=995050 RepID=A0A846QK80_9BACT|nr:DNA (cytosine-5)-methyltransferase 1 [Desulfobaculum xiamenense]